MIPIKTSVEDIEKLTGYLSRQIGWVETSKVAKALDSTATDERKLGAMAELGIIDRDGGNVRLSERGRSFASGNVAEALRDSIRSTDLYRSTAEWLMYGTRSTLPVTEIGQYWESNHKDTVGERKGSTLKDGAVCFARIFEGAGLAKFTVGRGGKESRLEVSLDALRQLLAVELGASSSEAAQSENANFDPLMDKQAEAQPSARTLVGQGPSAGVMVTTNPNVHVNIEIHIAADATATTVREIFRNMARYVLDRDVPEEL